MSAQVDMSIHQVARIELGSVESGPEGLAHWRSIRIFTSKGEALELTVYGPIENLKIHMVAS